MKVYTVDQGSGDWFKARLGKPTASQFHRILTPTGQRATGKEARRYIMRLVCERVLKRPLSDYDAATKWMERGKDLEPQARAALQFHLGEQIAQVGFVTNDFEEVGCSPDGTVVGKNEAVEIKCPLEHTQMGYLLDGLGEDYTPQVQGQMLVGGFDAVHFWAWHPEMPAYYQRTPRNPAYIAKLVVALNDFCTELDALTARALSLGDYYVAPQLETPLEAAYQENLAV
jgi:hypothetical protein